MCERLELIGNDPLTVQSEYVLPKTCPLNQGREPSFFKEANESLTSKTGVYTVH